MIDIENAVFDTVATAFDLAYPNGSRYGEPIDAPAVFPCMTLVEIDNYAYERSFTDVPTENDAWVVYEVNVYSNLQTGAKQQCRAIMNLVDASMQDLGFQRTMCSPTRNSAAGIYRLTARYRGVVSKDYYIYKQ